MKSEQKASRQCENLEKQVESLTQRIAELETQLRDGSNLNKDLSGIENNLITIEKSIYISMQEEIEISKRSLREYLTRVSELQSQCQVYKLFTNK